MNNLIIGLGNCGTQIVKAARESELLAKAKLYSIDSVASSVDVASTDRIKTIPIISDAKSGSGRNRERGAEMFLLHENDGKFEELYKDAAEAISPVVVITSSSGGTGSGATVQLCKSLVQRGIRVIPIIITPDMCEPDAYHLNTNDLFAEIAEITDGDGEVAIPTYSIFQNPKSTVNYDPVNKDVVNLIEIIFGMRYEYTVRDSIDDSDLDTVFSMPGRFIAAYAKGSDAEDLKKRITTKVFSSYQPACTENEANSVTAITAYSIKSMFAETDIESVFDSIRKRVPKVYDEFRHVVTSNDPGCEATVIITGLPRPAIKEINPDYSTATSLGEGLKKSSGSRPSFLKRKSNIGKSVITPAKNLTATMTTKLSEDETGTIANFKIRD